ncbi:polysaccharide pyruvyl transferase family protein [Pseudooceanicola aestuarii]|uniref:polysaccharide pyruvyl transferase family protein n=1 Tax=Pseudooceanicola aestuarii TaxID=2697319 RepID=UPI0013D2A125|nr:polysaccharide pyruvyl transferase family protein [Pseudooceanicola aestuarii]
MKIVQFGLCHSPNLGDGIIADCLAHGLRELHPGAQVLCIDLAGRRHRGAVTIAHRAALLAMLDRLPRSLRQPLARWKLNRVIDGVAEEWRAALAGADLALIGGGQILSDANLNFPVKLARAAALIAQAGVPSVIHGAGASANWSRAGTALFAGMLRCDLRRVGLRDAGSMAAWTAQMPNAPAPVLCPDPGLLAAECYGLPDSPPDCAPDGTAGRRSGGIGLCVTDFALLRHHADSPVTGQRTGAEPFYAGVVDAALDLGHRVTLFSNGAAEDTALLTRVAALPGLAGPLRDGRLAVPNQPTTPRALAHLIARCDAVVAHRLHACIVAHSYGLPVLGLSWDKKLAGFLDQAGAGDHLVTEAGATGASIAPRLEAALRTRPDPAPLANAARTALAATLAQVGAGPAPFRTGTEPSAGIP